MRGDVGGLSSDFCQELVSVLWWGNCGVFGSDFCEKLLVVLWERMMVLAVLSVRSWCWLFGKGWCFGQCSLSGAAGGGSLGGDGGGLSSDFCQELVVMLWEGMMVVWAVISVRSWCWFSAWAGDEPWAVAQG